MSWSVLAVGKPTAVKTALSKQFACAKQSTKNIPHECESVGAIEALVNGQLDFLSENSASVAVKVEACGNACVAPANAAWCSSTQVSLKVDPIHNFLE